MAVAADYFAATYAEARDKFIAALKVADGVLLDSHLHPLAGPAGEALYTDIGRVGPAKAKKLLVLVSGTHGPEGFCGSGCHTGWLARRYFQRQAGPDTAVLFVHAINPWGFAHGRRVTEDNVDLNRNFVDHGKPYPVNQPYNDLAAHINPADWTADSVKAHDAAIAAYHRRDGHDFMSKAVHGGQYVNPKGTFFGGTQPTWSNRTLRAALAEHAAHATDLAIIDYHSGGGVWGFFDLFIDDSLAGAPTRNWFAAVTSIADDKAQNGEDAQSNTPGNLIYAPADMFPDKRLSLCLTELRTGEGRLGLNAIRAENWVHHHGDRNSDFGRDLRNQLREAFYPSRPEWKPMVLSQSNDCIGQALAGLAGT
jgi:hypothetical protein